MKPRRLPGSVLLGVGVALAVAGVGSILSEDLQGGADAWGLIFLIAAAVAGLCGGALITSGRT